MRYCLLMFFIVMFTISDSYAQNTDLWGMTTKGGSDNIGLIFKTDANGNQTVAYQWTRTNDAKIPHGDLCTATNGKMYGLAYLGGTNNCGVLFEFDPSTGVYTKKYDFDGTSHGKYPNGSLIQASNGKLYGMTKSGGASGHGTIFEYNISTGILIKKVDFNGIYKGSGPKGSLVQASNGKLYGMTEHGGTNGGGVVFEYNIITNAFVKKVDFTGSSNGSNPSGSLCLATNNKLYGMTYYGGTHGKGVMFEFDPATSVYIKKINFNGTNNGGYPYGSLTKMSNGKLYGITTRGGTINGGTIFEFNPANNAFSKKLDFDFYTIGNYPTGSLLEANNGKLYGMAEIVGSIFGIIFEYDTTTATMTNIVGLDSLKGRYPSGALVQATNGKLYGMTSDGGAANYNGILLEYDIANDSLAKKLDFNGPNQGSEPKGELLFASNGKLYGMTSKGGYHGYGVLFEFDTSSFVFTKKFDFDGVNTGREPIGSLMQASNGKLYGMTSIGGSSDNGVLFEYDPVTNNYTKKLNFNGNNKGGYPKGSLIQAINGKLYGLTFYGGTNNRGILFEYNIANNTFIKKVDFAYTSNGSYPEGRLLQVSNGKMYGLTYMGGINGDGVLFEYDPSTSVFTKKVDFDGTNTGGDIQGSLIEAYNGKLYGLTFSGGTNNLGTLFEYDVSNNTLTKKIDFDGFNNGRRLWGNLAQANNGKLYGMTEYGGNIGYGVLFEYNPYSELIINKINFNGNTNGGNPRGSLIELGDCASDTINYSVSACGSYTVPSGDETYTTLGNYNVMDTLLNACGLNLFLDISLTINGSTTATDIITACDSYQWIDGNTYTANNNSATYTISNINGCDSIITLDLTVNSSTSGTDVVTACNSYQWIDGNTYSVSNNTATDTLTNATGCDSIVTLDLTINNSTSGIDVISACNSYQWIDGNIYTSDNNTATYTLTNANGCDSVVTLDLTINPNDVSVSQNDSSITANQNGASYQWLDCDNNNAQIAGATSQSFIPIVNGNYAVEIENGICKDTSNCIIFNTVGIRKSDNQNMISIFPNPNNGVVNIDLGTLKNVSVIVYSLTGDILYRISNISSKSFQFELNVAPGLYLVKVVSDDYQAYFELIMK